MLPAGAVLRMIRKHGPVSRAVLAKLSRLSKPTVSAQVEKLLRKGLVEEAGRGEAPAKGGRVPTLLRFNPDGGRLAAAELASAGVRLMVADLDGRVLKRETESCDPAHGPEIVLDALVRALDRALGPDRPLLRIVAVATPGRVDVSSGTVLETDNVFAWLDVPLGQMLESRLGVPAYVDNDVNMAALGEWHFGAARGLKNLLLVRANTGIGCGIISGGRLIHGSNWAAGEVGHMTLDYKVPAEQAGRRGYLETIVGSDLVARRKRMARGCMDQEIDEDVRAHLEAACANLAAVFDPEMIVLAGTGFDGICDRIRAAVEAAIRWPVDVCFSELGDEAAILGALASAGRGAEREILSGLGKRPG